MYRPDDMAWTIARHEDALQVWAPRYDPGVAAAANPWYRSWRGSGDHPDFTEELPRKLLPTRA